MQTPNISQIRFAITLIAVTGAIFVSFRSKYAIRNPAESSSSELLSESPQAQLESVVSDMEETQRKLEKHKERCIAIREAYRKQQIDFPKAHRRYSGELTASIERAIRGENPERIPDLEEKLKAHQRQISAHEIRLNNLQPAIEDMSYRIDDRISQIDQLTGQVAALERAGSESTINGHVDPRQEQELFLEGIKRLLALIQDELPRWGREIKDHQSFLRELSRFIQSIS